MRAAFADTITEIAKKRKDLFVITNDLGYSVLEPFIEKYPDKYLNVGIAEQNMIGIAAGLALSGFTPVIFSIIPFAIMRCFEQVRDDICYHNLNIKIVGVGSGLAYGSLGPTHHSIEDIALTRVLPNMSVICPGDPVEASLATKAMLSYKGPVYMRIHKKGDPAVHVKKPKFSIGRAITLLSGKTVGIITTGNMLPTSVAVAKLLNAEGISTGLIQFHTIKPLDVLAIQQAAKSYLLLFSIEEHSIIGGLGSAVSEVLAETDTKVLLNRIGIEDRFTKEVGSQDYLRKVNKLSTEDIYKRIKTVLKNL